MKRPCTQSSRSFATSRRRIHTSRSKSGGYHRAGLPASSLDRALDFGVLTFQPADKGLQSLTLGGDELVLLVHPRPIRSPRRKRVDIAEVGREVVIAHNDPSPARERVLRLYERKHAAINIQISLPSLDGIKRAVEMGVGVAVLPRRCALTEIERGDLVAVKIPELSARAHRPVRLPQGRGPLARRRRLPSTGRKLPTRCTYGSRAARRLRLRRSLRAEVPVASHVPLRNDSRAAAGSVTGTVRAAPGSMAVEVELEDGRRIPLRRLDQLPASARPTRTGARARPNSRKRFRRTTRPRRRGSPGDGSPAARARERIRIRNCSQRT